MQISLHCPFCGRPIPPSPAPSTAQVRGKPDADASSPTSPAARKEPAINRRRSSDLLYLTNPSVRKEGGGDKEEGSNFQVYTHTYVAGARRRPLSVHCCSYPAPPVIRFELSDEVQEKVKRASMIRRRVTLLAEPVRHRRTYRTAPDCTSPPAHCPLVSVC